MHDAVQVQIQTATTDCLLDCLLSCSYGNRWTVHSTVLSLESLISGAVVAGLLLRHNEEAAGHKLARDAAGRCCDC